MPFNLYKFIHRTIRGQVSQLIIQAGRTTFHDHNQVTTLHRSVLNLASFLENHAMREDTCVHPVLQEKGFPDLGILEREHQVTEGQLKEIVSQITAIKDETAAGTNTTEALDEKGYDFYLTLSNFVGAYLSHVNTEERKAMPFLQSKLSDPELFAINGRMQSTVTNEEVIHTIPAMYPYLNLAEAIKLTQMLKAHSGDDFPAMIEAIKQSLEPEMCKKVFKSAGVEDKSMDLSSSSATATAPIADTAKLFQSAQTHKRKMSGTGAGTAQEHKAPTPT